MNKNKFALNLVLIITLIASALLFGLLEKPTEMGLIIIGCSICLAFANIDQIQRFKGAGFEAEMKKAVEEAYATTESLRALAKPLVLSMLENLIYAGRWGGMNGKRKHKLKEELDALSNSLEIHDESISSMLHQFYIWHGIDHIVHIENVMSHKNSGNKQVTGALRALCDRSVKELPSVAAVKEALASLQQEELTVLEPFVEDYAHYRTYKSLRRPESIEQ